VIPLKTNAVLDFDARNLGEHNTVFALRDTGLLN